MAWRMIRGGGGSRLRVALHPLQECEAMLRAAPRDAERAALPVWAAAIDEAARAGIASGWQLAQGLVIGVLPQDAPVLPAAFTGRALDLITSEGQPYLVYQMGSLACWPVLWSEVGPLRHRWGRRADARAGGLCGMSVLDVAWANACVGAAARRLGAEPLGRGWEPAGDQMPVVMGGDAQVAATVFCPVTGWLEAMCSGGATKEIVEAGLRASLSPFTARGRNSSLAP